ncbi:glycosyltransferase [Homoserinibacter sp. YIM 151385]|uniref:glycosyltransferase n=1 Tax=Homoserinibacter sp. YIM 151385 TaxID=2985506 RepID=UPI0022F0391A|nr:glycosyltransferase [Homoserinibacter sp. YIM 151385]WBU38808.1 glycosyltransferase [Homoserinibacter sp. YIM 151385]
MADGSASPRRVLLATAGSRGDVEPFLSLAAALRDAGHAVLVAAPDDQDDAGDDVDVVTLGVSFAGLAEALAGGGMRAFREHIRPAMSTVLARVVDEAMRWQPDVIVAHPKLLTVPVVAEHLGIPYLSVELTPVVTPTGEFPAAGVVNRSLGPWVNRLTYRAADLGARMFASDIRAARRRLGRSGEGHLPSPSGSLVAVSPTLLPRPADWPSTTHLTGDWPRRPRPDAGTDGAIREFLADDAPFVYAGFGSMRGGDAAGRAEAIIEGVRRAGLRTLVATGWGGLQPPDRCLGTDVLVVTSVPHATVLPHAAAAIHHGGAGTVHAAARAGTPSVLVPFLADQPFWARLLRRSGLAGPALHRDRLSVDGVHAAISDALDRAPAVHHVAGEIRAEDGPAAASAIVAAVAAGESAS